MSGGLYLSKTYYKNIVGEDLGHQYVYWVHFLSFDAAMLEDRCKRI